MPAIKTIAVIGTGTIGASWAALFIGHGYDVVASDPGPDAEARMRSFVAAALPDARPEPPVTEGTLTLRRHTRGGRSPTPTSSRRMRPSAPT